ncbi:hypothetical protein ACP4OV_000568 [Aristida adscensionis]
MAIAKTQGCNKVVCDNCGKPFCYRCGRAISDYGHFAQQVRVNGHGVVEEDDDIPDPGDQVPLPHLRRQAHQVGSNNHLVCRTCRTQYCALCWKRFWSAAEHYGSSDCQPNS